MTAPTITLTDDLAPVRAALLDRASLRAARIREEAEEEARKHVLGARQEADAVLAEARARGRADAARLVAAARVRVRRRAAETVLLAQGDVYRELHRRVRTALQDLRHEATYPPLTQRLTEQARARVGTEATVTEHPAGGVTVESATELVDCSLDALAARAVVALGEEVSQLWAS